VVVVTILRYPTYATLPRYLMNRYKAMRILVTNDDGVHAPGIQALAEALRAEAEVIVVAPDRDHSAASHSLTVHQPVRATEVAPNVIAVQGTPTDCVHMAVTGFLDELPDMVVSGINHGANLGDDVLYSGTVAAAIEGRFLGLPAIAISLVGKPDEYMVTAAHVAQRLVQQVKADPLPKNTILNVNVPGCALADISGHEICRLGARHRAEPTVCDQDPRGRPIYWIGPAGPEQDAGEGTDFWALRHNKVAITPLQIDMTDYQAFDQLSGWARGLS